jgi:hypothetical protein
MHFDIDSDNPLAWLISLRKIRACRSFDLPRLKGAEVCTRNVVL